MVPQIPSRNTSKYSGQYAGTVDSQRMVEIFTDSYKIALSSKNPETARARFDLAIEAYYQLFSMKPSSGILKAIQQSIENLVAVFPAQVTANEALGLREKARKLKTPKKQLDLLYHAREIIDRGLIEQPFSSVLQTAAIELVTEIYQAEALNT